MLLRSRPQGRGVALFVAGLRRLVDICRRACLTIKSKKEERHKKEEEREIERVRHCSTCQCHHRIAQIGVFLDSPPLRRPVRPVQMIAARWNEPPDVHSTVVQLRMSHSAALTQTHCTDLIG